MVSGIDYEQRYIQAHTAYMEGDLEEAHKIIDSMAEDYPDDPNILLLKGHIYLELQEYELAEQNYHSVIELSENKDIINAAYEGLEQINQAPQGEMSDLENFYSAEEGEIDDLENYYPAQENEFAFDTEEDLVELEDNEDWTNSIKFDSMEMDWEPSEIEEEDLEDPTLQQNSPIRDNQNFADYHQSENLTKHKSEPEPFDELFDSPNDQEDESDDRTSNDFSWENNNSDDYALDEINMELAEEDIDYENFEDEDEEFDTNDLEDNGTPTFVVSSDSEDDSFNSLEDILSNSDDDLDFDDDYDDYSSELEPLTSGYLPENNSLISAVDNSKEFTTNDDDDDDLIFTADELDDIPDIGADELPVSSIFTKDDSDTDLSSNLDFEESFPDMGLEEDFTSPSSVANIPVVTPTIPVKPDVEIFQSKYISLFLNAPLQTKQLISAGATGLITFLALFIFSFFNAQFSVQVTQKGAPKKVTYPWAQRALLSLIAGVTSSATTFGIGQLLSNHLKRYTNNLQSQFEYIYQGNFNVKATVYSQDEFGQLAAGFNQMAKNINTITTEARKRAEETERAREDLQRQVIRLLDDVEGAARGDLTVQAEVTADVLGAVADAFNLTITNLQEIVIQVKKAALQVNKGSTDSELFARNQSSDALRMAEELAVTLNSVQMMTDSIQRVAENAREAEEVARSSSVTALKGGDAVERTVAGILQIRETVSETTRKVKRLAEASQQISTIVAVISQISSRTNLLALNASIQAARAGEAGRGFAVVADEVRQLADRSAKSLQEIEQIVLQIQTETGSVMTAMEEGIQQVLDVTERSESAKRSLEDIIQVSNRIDALVRSITADTVEQRENSRAVARVMQAVELTAQATSQESQRVAGSLQNLVGIARDLLSSVERFKVGKEEDN